MSEHGKHIWQNARFCISAQYHAYVELEAVSPVASVLHCLKKNSLPGLRGMRRKESKKNRRRVARKHFSSRRKSECELSGKCVVRSVKSSKLR